MNAMNPPRRSAMSLYANPAHKAVARMVGYVLTLGDTASWHGLTMVLIARLSDTERAALAYAALNSLDESDAYKTASVALFGTLDGESV